MFALANLGPLSHPEYPYTLLGVMCYNVILLQNGSLRRLLEEESMNNC